MNWEQGTVVSATKRRGTIQTNAHELIDFRASAVRGRMPTANTLVCFQRAAPGAQVAEHVVIAMDGCDTAEMAWQLDQVFRRALGDAALSPGAQREVVRLAAERASLIEQPLSSGEQPSSQILVGRINLAEAAMTLMAIEAAGSVHGRVIEVDDLRSAVRRQRPRLPSIRTKHR